MYVKDGTSVLKKVLVSKPQFLKPAPINEIAKLWKDTTMDVDVMLREHQEFCDMIEQRVREHYFAKDEDEAGETGEASVAEPQTEE